MTVCTSLFLPLALFGLFSLSVPGQPPEPLDLLTKYKREINADRRSSLPHFRLGEIYFQQHKYQDAGNEFRAAIEGDLQPRWVEVWARLNLGKMFDMTGQRERALTEYRNAQRTKDNTRGAQDEVELYMRVPYAPAH